MPAGKTLILIQWEESPNSFLLANNETLETPASLLYPTGLWGLDT